MITLRSSETGYDYGETTDYQDGGDYSDAPEAQDDFESRSEREERQSALDEALSNLGRDDEDLPVYHGGSAFADEREEMVYGESVSFYDQLKEQMGELDMTERQRDIMEYLIGSSMTTASCVSRSMPSVRSWPSIITSMYQNRRWPRRWNCCRALTLRASVPEHSRSVCCYR